MYQQGSPFFDGGTENKTGLRFCLKKKKKFWKKKKGWQNSIKRDLYWLKNMEGGSSLTG